MTSLGRVRVWHHEEGWGVVDSEVTPGGCWTHFSCVLVPGFKTLKTGEEVTFSFEVADQDGFSFRAVEVWPADQDPVRDHEESGPSSAYRSTLALTFDDDDGGRS